MARRGRWGAGFSRPSAGTSESDHTRSVTSRYERVELFRNPDELDLGERMERSALEVGPFRVNGEQSKKLCNGYWCSGGNGGPRLANRSAGAIALSGVRDVDAMRELTCLVVVAQGVPSGRLDELLEREVRRLGLHVRVDAQLPVVREAAIHGSRSTVTRAVPAGRSSRTSQGRWPVTKPTSAQPVGS